MHSELFRLGPLTFHGYGLMMALGFLAALTAWRRIVRKRGIVDVRLLPSLMLWMMVWGIAGARVWYVLTHWGEFAPAPWRILRIDQGGLVFYGGLFGALAGLGVFIRKHRLPVLPVLDLVAAGLPLGHAFGRIGCFLHGCCFGRIREGLGSVCFPPGSIPWWHHVHLELLPRTAEHSLPVIPTQLLSAAGNGVIFVILYRLAVRKHRPGLVAVAYMLLYAPMRFFVEFLRADPRGAFGPLSLSQWVSLLLFGAGLAGLGFVTHRDDAADEPAADSSGKADRSNADA